jgi:hypothetical protein
VPDAYQMDYGATAAKHVDAFFANIQWDVVASRLYPPNVPTSSPDEQTSCLERAILRLNRHQGDGETSE